MQVGTGYKTICRVWCMWRMSGWVIHINTLWVCGCLVLPFPSPCIHLSSRSTPNCTLQQPSIKEETSCTTVKWALQFKERQKWQRRRTEVAVMRWGGGTCTSSVSTCHVLAVCPYSCEPSGPVSRPVSVHSSSSRPPLSSVSCSYTDWRGQCLVGLYTKDMDWV